MIIFFHTQIAAGTGIRIANNLDNFQGVSGSGIKHVHAVWVAPISLKFYTVCTVACVDTPHGDQQTSERYRLPSACKYTHTDASNADPQVERTVWAVPVAQVYTGRCGTCRPEIAVQPGTTVQWWVERKTVGWVGAEQRTGLTGVAVVEGGGGLLRAMCRQVFKHRSLSAALQFWNRLDGNGLA